MVELTQSMSMRSKLLTHGAIIVGFLTLWQLAAHTAVLDPFWFSSPLGTVEALTGLVASGRIFVDLYATVSGAAIGMFIAFLASIPVVVVMSTSKFAERVIGPIVDFVYAIPKVALIPVLVLLLGIGQPSKIVLVVLLVVFIFIYDLRAGNEDVDRKLVLAMQVMGAGHRDVIMHVRVPTMTSYVVAAARVAGPTALTGAIFSEYFAGQNGIGGLVYQSALFFRADELFAGVIVIVPVAYAIDWLFRSLNTKTSGWRRA